VLQAGKNPLTLDEILRLHAVLIEDTRFTQAGLRPDGVFLGERDHKGDPLPEFIGARPQDLPPLMQGVIDANERMREGELDSVLQAAATAKENRLEALWAKRLTYQMAALPPV